MSYVCTHLKLSVECDVTVCRCECRGFKRCVVCYKLCARCVRGVSVCVGV